MFSDSAARLAGFAGALLGWRPPEFWQATPAELAGILELFAPAAREGASTDDLERLKRMFPDG